MAIAIAMALRPRGASLAKPSLAKPSLLKPSMLERSDLISIALSRIRFLGERTEAERGLETEREAGREAERIGLNASEL